MAADINKVIETLDKSAEWFDGVLKKTEKKLFDESVVLLKDLDLTPDGKVKTSIANLKKIASIKSKLTKLAEGKDYLQSVSEIAKIFDELQKQQNAYFASEFPSNTLAENYKDKRALMKQIATNNTIEALTGAGLQENVTSKLNDILLRAVTSSEKFSDLQEEFRKHLIGEDGGTGALTRYAGTYAVTAMSQFTRQNNKLLTQDLGLEWFMYVGSNIETTREFCQHLTKKRYIHISELPDILRGKIDGHQCAIYKKTGLPYGMIEGTTEETLQVNCGGWNCRHQLVPIAKEAVPKELIQKKEVEGNKQKIAELKSQLAQYEQWKDADTHGIAAAVASGDIDALTQYIVNMQAIEKKLEQLSLIPDAKEAAKQFTFDQLQAVQDAVAKKLAQLASMPLHVQAKKLTDEITIYADKLKKYPTWQIAEAAYSAKLQEVQTAIAMQSIKSEFYALQTYKTKSPQYKDTLSQLNDAIASGYVTKAQSLVSELKAKQAALDARKSKYAQKAHQQTNFDDDAYTQERLDNAVWNRRNDSDCIDKHYEISNVEDVWSHASSEEKHAAYQYTSGSSYLTETLRGGKCKFWRYKNGRLDEIERDTEALTRLIDKSYCTQDVWVKRDDLLAFCVYRWNLVMKPEIIKWYRKKNRIPYTTTDSQIEKSLEYTSTGGERNYQEILRAYYKRHPNELVGITGTDESFLSTANNKKRISRMTE